MRDWSLRAGDPFSLTLAADARLGAPDYVNDQIWELDLGAGEPAALSLRTTYGLRARAMRLFVRFLEGGKAFTDPAGFATPPRVTRVYPNFITVEFSPLPGVDVSADYYVPSSQVITGRLIVANRAVIPHPLKLELCGQLVPINGQSFAPLQMQSVTVLEGRTENLAPVLFMTGGPQPGIGPYPSLLIGLDLAPGASRTLTWVLVSLADHKSSFDLARRSAARAWDAERARIELLNDSQAVEIFTGDPDWDAALALSQKAAFGMLFPPSPSLPHTSFILSRQPDQGFSRRGDGMDHSHFWSGQPPLETLYLSTLLPGAPGLARGFLLNFLATQTDEGEIDCKPGLAGQRGKFLAAPLLATLAWRVYESTRDRNFLTQVYPRLLEFFRAWLAPEHDRDGNPGYPAGNSLPEWSHVLQTGFEENPLFDPWHPWAQGADITAIQSPTLAAMLYREARTLMRIGEELSGEGQPTDPGRLFLKTQAGLMRAGIEDCWDPERSFYRYADRDTHLSPPGKVLSQRRAASHFSLQKNLEKPARLLIRINVEDGATPRPELTIHGELNGSEQSEHLAKTDFTWSGGGAVATSRQVYTSLGQFSLEGVPREARITIQTLDLTFEDHTLFLPLWAGIPHPAEAELLLLHRLFRAEYFGRPFGVPALPTVPAAEAEGLANSVHLPWNQLIAEGLLSYGLRQQAATLLAHLMNAVIDSLKRDRAFRLRYHAESGIGLGEKNALAGLAPVGLFLQTLGVEILSAHHVRLSGSNPFVWPVTVKYRGLTVARGFKQTEITFPGGQSVSRDDPTDADVFAE
jgi:mannosylglycerate hydrolase MGH1-like protein